MRKKAFTRLLIILLLVAMMLGLSSCEKADEKIHLRWIIAFYSNGSTEWWQDFANDFNEQNPDIELEIESVSWENLKVIATTRISTNQIPDILVMYTFTDYVADDLLLPVAAYLSDALQENLIDRFREDCSADGTQWAVPLIASVRPLFYNKTILKEAGYTEPPKTWEDVAEICEAIQEKVPDVVPFGLDLSTIEGEVAFTAATIGFGGGFVDENDNWIINSDDNVRALTTIYDYYKKGYFGSDPCSFDRIQQTDAFKGGTLGMMVGICNMVGDLDGIDYGITYLPTDGEHDPFIYGVYDMIMAFKDPDAPDQEARNEAIGRVLDFYYDCDRYSEYMVFENFLPVTKDSSEYLPKHADRYPVYATGKPGDNDYYSTFCGLLNDCVFIPSYKNAWTDAKLGVMLADQRIVQGEDVREVLSELQEKILSIEQEYE